VGVGKREAGFWSVMAGSLRVSTILACWLQVDALGGKAGDKQL
jgi:hypothetical protein